MIKLFSGSSNPTLSSEVAKLLNTTLAKSEIVRFGNSEVRVTIQDTVKDATCAVIQPTANPTDTNLMELVFFCDALKRQEAKKVLAVIPYFGYARQNIQHRPGENVGANVVIRLLETVGFDEVWTFDIHDEGTAGIFDIPFKNLSALPLLAQKVRNYLGKNIDETKIAVASPDQGGVERARNFSKAFFEATNYHLVIGEKNRNLDKIHDSQSVDIYGDVSGKTVIFVDDIITSGVTLLPAAQLCLKRGATRIIAAVTHHDFAKDTPQKLENSPIEKFFTTNTITLKEDQKIAKLTEFSVASILVPILNSFA